MRAHAFHGLLKIHYALGKFYLKPLKSFSQIVIISSIFQIIQTEVQKGLCVAKTTHLANSRVESQTQI